jgi:hypothetical protein
MERNAGNGIVGVRLSEICHDNALSFKGLDIRSRPLTFQWVGKRKKRGPEHGLEFREMAMKERLILGAIVLLLVSWFALDAVAEVILL